MHLYCDLAGKTYFQGGPCAHAPNNASIILLSHVNGENRHTQSKVQGVV